MIVASLALAATDATPAHAVRNFTNVAFVIDVYCRILGDATESLARQAQLAGTTHRSVLTLTTGPAPPRVGLRCGAELPCAACSEPNHHTLERVLGGKRNLNLDRQPIAAMSPLPFALYTQKYNASDDKYRGCSYRSDHGPSHRRIVTDAIVNEGADAVAVRRPAAADPASTRGSVPDRPGKAGVQLTTAPGKYPGAWSRPRR